MIELSKFGQTVRFDDTGVDREKPGRVRQFLFNGRFYEEKFLNYVRSLGRRGVYIDAGAFIGTHTLYFAMLCEATHVFAFEPRTAVFDELVRNVSANGLEEKVTLSRLGLAAERSITTTILDDKQEVFECAPLDELVAERNVAVLKIDVEGMEVPVLRGATRILRESKPLIFAEAHEERDRRALEEYLAPFGYVWTGRNFNATPTYELAYASDPFVRDALARNVAEVERQRSEMARLRADTDDLRAFGSAREAEINELRSWGVAKEAAMDKVREWGNAQEADKVRLWKALEKIEHQLEAARTSLAYRLGRATTTAVRQAKAAPWKAPGAWLDAFRGPDQVLEQMLRDARKVRRSIGRHGTRD